MPTYDYRCTQCEHTFERVLKIAEMNFPVCKPCPECGDDTVEKYITGNGGFNADVLPKIDGGFSEVIEKIKAAHPHNAIPDY